MTLEVGQLRWERLDQPPIFEDGVAFRRGEEPEDLQDGGPMAGAFFGIEGQFLDVNLALVEMLGYLRDKQVLLHSLYSELHAIIGRQRPWLWTETKPVTSW